MKVLVTGSSGQVGTCLVKQLNNKVNLLALNSTELNITNENDVNDIVLGFKPNIIINAAAYTAVDMAEDELELSGAVNAKGAEYLAKSAYKVGAAILHISTDYVFDGSKNIPYTETDNTNPQNSYGKTKLAGENAVKIACPRHIILRTAWVFSEYGNNFVKTMLRLATERTELSIVADQFGGPTFADDIATTLVTFAQRIYYSGFKEYGVYNYSGLPYVSWYEFAQYIFQQAVYQGVISSKPIVNPINTNDYPTKAKRPANSCLNLSKIQLQGIKESNWKSALQHIEKYKNDRN